MKLKDISLRPLTGSKFGSSSPTKTDDNLFSTDVVEVVLGVTEGPILGLEDGAKSFLIGDTPLQSVNGTNNFNNFELLTYKGTELGTDIQSRLGGFGSSTSVNTEMASNTPIIRQGVHTKIDYLDLRLVINQLVMANDDGNFEHTGKFKVEYKAVSSPTWLPVKTPVTNPMPPQITAEGFDIFYGQDTNAEAINASPGDRPTFLSSTQPISTASAGIWFNSSNNYQPKCFNGSSWFFPTGLSFSNGVWTWSETSSWGRDKSTRAIVGATVKGKTFEQGDYWVNTATSKVYFYNGSAWIIAGSSLRPGTFGSNATGGSVTVSDGEIAITGKTQSPFVKEFRIPVPNINEPYMLRVTKTSPDNTSEEFFDITWESFQEVTAKAYNFPGLAVTQLVARASEQFSSIPDFSGIYKGRIIRVPSNYNPVTRTYTGVWDGTWKLAYSNNPAYVANDLVVNDRYGMNAYYPITLNKWDVYEAGVWCDSKTQSGDPRFTFNALISDPRGGRDMINYICGIFGGRFFDDGNGTGTIKIDRDDAAVAVFSPENVVDGLFTFSWTSMESRHNDITVTFVNPDLNWQEDRRRVFDKDHIAKYGRIPLNFIAVGCTSEREAIVRGSYKLATSLTETMLVNFKTNRMGLYLSPYDVVLVSDVDMGLGVTGRVKAVNGKRQIQLRDPIFLEPGFSYRMSVQLVSPTGEYVIETRNLAYGQSGSLTAFNVTSDLPVLPDDAVFTIEQINGKAAPKPFRILSITEAEGDPDNVEIQAIEVNRGKWLFVDGVVDSLDELDQYLLDTKSKPKGPTDLRIKPRTIKSGKSVTTNLTLDWNPSPTKTVSYYKIRGSRNNGPLSTLGDTLTTEYEWHNVPAGEYVFKVTAVDVNGYESDPAVIEHRLVGDTRVVDGVTGLRLVDEPSATVFESRSPLFQWVENKSPTFEEYLVRILATNGTVLRSEYTTKSYYSYEYSVNETDGGGTPRRSFKIQVASKDQYGFLSDFEELTVSNPAPAAPATQSVVLAGETALVKYEVPPLRDFQGALIHASTTQGFTPNSSNIVYKGPTNSVNLALTKGQTWYFRIGLYDVFDDGTLNYGNELSLAIPAGPEVDTTAPNPPTSFAVAPGVGFISASWVNDSASDLEFVELFYNTTNNVSTSKFGVASYGTRGVIPGLDHGVTYYVWARSVDKTGNRSGWTGPQSTSVIYIDSDAIAANAITTDKLAALSITAAKLQDGIIDTSKIVANAITSAQLAANSVTAADLAALAVNAEKIADNAVGTVQIAANAITAAQLAANSVTATSILANAVTAVAIAAGAITAGKIAANAVTAGTIAAGAVTAGTIAANAVTSDTIAANAITAKKLVVTDGSNILRDAQIKDPSLWTLDGVFASGWAFGVNDATSGNITSIRHTGSLTGTADTYARAYSEALPCEAGREYVVGVSVKAAAGTNGRLYVGAYFYNEAGTYLSQQLCPIVNASGFTTEGDLTQIVTAPLGASFIRWVFMRYTDVGGTTMSGTVDARFPYIRRATSGELIVDGAVKAGKIAANAVTANEIAALSITGAKIAANTVTAANIAAGAITASELAANAVTATQIAAGAVTSTKIAADAVTATHINVTNLAAISATLGSVNISSAVIGTLTVGTSNIATGAITAAVAGTGGSTVISAGTTYNLIGLTVSHGTNCSAILVWAEFGITITNTQNNSVSLSIYNATSGAVGQDKNMAVFTPAAGSTSTTIYLRASGFGYTVNNSVMIVQAAKR